MSDEQNVAPENRSSINSMQAELLKATSGATVTQLRGALAVAKAELRLAERAVADVRVLREQAFLDAEPEVYAALKNETERARFFAVRLAKDTEYQDRQSTLDGVRLSIGAVEAELENRKDAIKEREAARADKEIEFSQRDLDLREREVAVREREAALGEAGMKLREREIAQQEAAQAFIDEHVVAVHAGDGMPDLTGRPTRSSKNGRS